MSSCAPACARISCRSRSTPAPVFADRQHVARAAVAPPSSRRLDSRRDAGEIDLVVDDDPRQRRRQRVEDRDVGVGDASARRARRRAPARDPPWRDGRPGALDAERLDRIVGRAQSRGVDDRQRDAVDLDRALDRVARRAGDRRDDRDLVAGEPVEQARLADVRRADQDDGEAVAQQRALARARERPARAAPRIAASLPCASAARRKSMSSSGKSSVASVNIRSSIERVGERADLARERRPRGCAPPRAPPSRSRRRSDRRRPRPARGRACRSGMRAS